MNINAYARKLLWPLLVGLLLPAIGRSAIVEEKFDLLQTRTGQYTNVTVTTKAKSFICILHSRGIGTIQITDLPDDALIRLGYQTEEQKKSDTLPAKMSAQVKQTLSNLNLPTMDQVQQSWKEKLRTGFSRHISNQTLLIVASGVAFSFYLLFCYCGQLICEKTGTKPGILIWVPILQLVPLLRAARMSPGWLLAFLLPGLNILAGIVWAVKITKARAKSGLVALLLLLPGINLFAFLYLAFSSAAKVKEKAERPAENMTLQTA